MNTQFPVKVLIVFVEGYKASIYRNQRFAGNLELHKIEDWKPQDFSAEGPMENKSIELSQQGTSEAIFARQVTARMNQMSRDQLFNDLLIVAGPKTLEQIRPWLNETVNAMLIEDCAKILTDSSVENVQRSFG